MTSARAGAQRAHAETARSRTTRGRHAGSRVRRTAPGPKMAVVAPRGARHRRQRSRLRVVAPPRRRRLPFLIATFLIVGTLVVGVASVQAVVSQGSFRMQELTNRNEELEEDYGRLKLRVAELSAPGRIATEARRLGFHVPDGVRALPVRGAVPVNSVTGTGDPPIFSLKGVLERGP